MSRRLPSCCLWFSLLTLLLVARPVSAQLAVIDPANLSQAILIAERTWAHYEQLRREFEVIRRMAQPLGNLDRYRIPPVTAVAHDPSRWQYGRDWIQALNTGDPRGTAYLQTAVPLQRPGSADLGRMTPTARRDFQRRYATTEITDSVAMLGAHQVALVRGYAARLQAAVQNLETDVVSGQAGVHEMTAILDKVAAGELLGRRQDMATNQLLTHALEQLLARSKRLRDTEAGHVNMQLTTWRDSRTANDAFADGTGDALRTWRQP